MRKEDVCVLLPAYNEEKNIERVVLDVRAQGYAALVIDDGSTDSTPEIIRSLGVAAVFSGVNEGKGASLQKGFDWLLQSPFKACVLMDSDGQHAAGEIGNFIEALEAGADLVVGNRMADPSCMPFIRVATNRIMSRIISNTAGQSVPDTQCGYRALSRRALETVKLKTARFEIESEMILRVADAGLGIASIPISCVYGDEVSHIRPVRDTIRFFKFLSEYRHTRDKLSELRQKAWRNK
jgi:glycosyltransferase involved in cell wall biosynthesis